MTATRATRAHLSTRAGSVELKLSRLRQDSHIPSSCSPDASPRRSSRRDPDLRSGYVYSSAIQPPLVVLWAARAAAAGPSRVNRPPRSRCWCERTDPVIVAALEGILAQDAGVHIAHGVIIMICMGRFGSI